MRIRPANEEKIRRIVKQINVKISPGFDGLRAIDIKNCSILVPVITHLINRCLKTSIYPDLLKIGVIRPIHKKGKCNDYNNYRPITILSCLDKIIERYVSNEIVNHL